MEPAQNQEPLFCDLCNLSVPLRDLEVGAARRVKDRLVGACCLRELVPQQDPQREPAARRGGFAGVVLIVAAVAGATVFLDWRIGDEISSLQGRVASEVDGTMLKHGSRLAAIEGRVGTTVEKADLATVAERMKELQQRVEGAVDKSSALDGRLDGMQAQLGKSQEELLKSRKEHDAAVQRLEGALQAIAADIGAIRAVPRATAPSEAQPMPNPEAAVPAPREAAPGGLSRELQHHIASLTDSDAGVRFQAVSALIDSKSPAVREALLTMVKDPDLFVRRVTLEGLRGFRHSTCVDALLTALADPESLVRHTAYQSLRHLTGTSIGFDPNGTRDERSAAIRKLREWWEENKKSFGS